MPQISPISWSVVLTLLIILIVSTSTQISHLPDNPSLTNPITTNNNPTNW